MKILRLIFNHRHFLIKFSIIFNGYLYSQIYLSADSYYTMMHDKSLFDDNTNLYSTAFRPLYISNKKNLFLSYKSEFYFNNNAPNQENMDVRYFGKGLGYFNAFHFTWISKFISFSAEPYILQNQNKQTKIYERPSPYRYLNDVVQLPGKKITKQGLRNAHIYIHYKGIGIGLSNENMWWGPGLQSSLSMTNNTVGFKHYSFGTIKEKRYKKFGFHGKYTLATIEKNDLIDDSYFTSIGGIINYYSNPIITIGFTRNYMTGGMSSGHSWNISDASKIIFEGLFLENLEAKKYTTAKGGDAFDQTITGFISLLYPQSKLKIYMELGYNDNRQNLWDFIIHPDHSVASIIGLQNYGVFNNENLVLGFEYFNAINSRMQVFRDYPPWFAREHYNDWSYEGRRWAAHSGSDSDDLLVFFGWFNKKWSIIPGLNYERHGVTTHRPPEVKFEFRLNTHYTFKNGLILGAYFERQFEAHLGFPNDHFWLEVTGKRNTNTVIFRLEKQIEL